MLTGTLSDRVMEKVTPISGCSDFTYGDRNTFLLVLVTAAEG